jgi:hypothetical protein
MLTKLTLGAAVVAAAAFLVPAASTPTSAAPLSEPALLTGEAAEQGLVEEARWRRRRVCRRVCHGVRYWTPFGYQCRGYWRTSCYWR